MSATPSGDSRSRAGRRLLDGFGVVVAILTAFGIDAWWQERVGRATTEELLSALQVEWQAEDQRLAEALATIAGNRAAMVGIIEAHRVSSLGISEDSAVALWERMPWTTFKPAQGALNSLLLTDLDNVSDPALRNAIAAWPGVVDEAAPEKNALEELGLMLVRYETARVSNSLGLPWHPEGGSARWGLQSRHLAPAVIADEDYVVRLRQVQSVLTSYEADLLRMKAILEENLSLF